MLFTYDSFIEFSFDPVSRSNLPSPFNKFLKSDSKVNYNSILSSLNFIILLELKLHTPLQNFMNT